MYPLFTPATSPPLPRVQVFKTYDFHFPITLVMIHTVITFLGLFTASAMGFFDRKDLPVNPRLILAGSFVFYNAASLVNLNVNTVRSHFYVVLQ